jgi:predicted lipoprotein with Yx(FWY)xxD motif
VRRSNVYLVAILAAAPAVLGACASSSKSSPAATAVPPVSVDEPAAHPTVSTVTTSLGKVLVDSRGMTLYLYDKDRSGTTKCTGVCTSVWPPLAVTGSLTYGGGVSASMFSTITRADGTKQLAVNGMPLYTYTGDLRPGDITGQANGDFYVAGANGKMIGHAPSS